MSDPNVSDLSMSDLFVCVVTLPRSDRRLVMVMNSKSEKVSDFTNESEQISDCTIMKSKSDISESKSKSEQISDAKGDVPVYMYIFAIMSLVDLLLSALEMPVCLNNSNDKVVPVEDSVLWISDS